MKKNENIRVTLSDKAYFKYYNYRGFFSLFVSSLLEFKLSIIKETFISLSFALVGFFIVDITFIDKPREFISGICTGLTSYSITVIGFLLISFTMLIILNNTKSVFRYFALEDLKYKKPLIRMLLGVFIIPIGVFILLFLFSIIIGFLLPVFGTNYFIFEYKRVIFKLFISITLFLFTYSIWEFLSFFYNIYNFIVISSYDMAIEYEQKKIKSNVLPQLSLNEDIDEKKIIDNIKTEQVNINDDSI